jgi:hypothetical protein
MSYVIIIHTAPITYQRLARAMMASPSSLRLDDSQLAMLVTDVALVLPWFAPLAILRQIVVT